MEQHDRYVIMRRRSEGYSVGPATPPDPGATPEPEPEPEPVEEVHWFEVSVVDEVGEPIPNVGLEFSVGSASTSMPTGGGGTARVDGADVTSGSITITNISAVLSALESRWSTARTGSPPSGANVVTIEPEAGTTPRLAIRAETTETVVLESPLTKVEAKTITFSGNHALMKVNTTDWTQTGPAHTTPEWTKGNSETRPASYTKGGSVALDLTVDWARIKGPAEPISMTGAARFGNLNFTGSGEVRGSGAQPLTMSGAPALEDKVQMLSGSIQWNAHGQNNGVDYASGSSTGHKLFVTYNTPESVAGSREEGITEKRMEAAVPLVARANTNDPHDIVAYLMSRFDHYTLRPHPSVPAEFDHPTYFNDIGGAWPMADYINRSGECQAIVRFVRAAIKQVGVPGTADLVVVWSDPDVNGGSTALEEVSPPGGGLNGKTKVVGGKTWYACLVDTYPVEGQIYDTQELNAHYMGLNNFEACLRFEHGGVKRYYGGGAGAYTSANQVLLAFYALAWVSFGHTHPTTGNRGAKVEKVVKRWRDSSGNIL
jgi:hypothetical protein